MKIAIRFISVSVLLLICSLSAHAQVGRTFLRETAGNGYRIRITKDGGFFVAGNVVNNASVGSYWIGKFNAREELLWDTAYGEQYNASTLWSVEPTRLINEAGLQGAFICGYTIGKNSRGDALVVKVGPNGELLKEFQPQYTNYHHYHFFTETDDSTGYFFCGHMSSPSSNLDGMWAGKYDNNYKLLWEHFDSTFNHAHAGVLTSNGEMVICGHTVWTDGTQPTRTKSWSMRLDAKGNVIWHHIYPSTTWNVEPYEIIRTKENGFAMFGGESNDRGTVQKEWMLVMDSLGNAVVEKNFSHTSAFAWGGRQTKDGGFIIAGSDDPGNGPQPYIVKTDAAGNKKWEALIDTVGSGETYAIMEKGNRYVATGATGNDIWLIDLDTLGNVIDYRASVAHIASRAPSAEIVTYPNPLLGNFSSTQGATFSLSSEIKGIGTLEITDALGRSIVSLPFSSSSVMWNGRDQIGNLVPSGTYYSQVRTAAQVYHGSFVVNR
jgi:hypothetical protein